MKKSNRELETPKVFHDSPLRDSDECYFHFDEFAVTLARLIAAKETRTPLTIGVSGPWGSGKTTLLRRTRKMLDATIALADAQKAVQLAFANDQDNPQQLFRVCRTVWFDAWKYANEDQLLVALIRVILAEMMKGNLGDKFWRKVLDPQHPRYNVLAAFLGFFKVKVGGAEIGFDIEKYKSETPFAQNTAFYDFFEDAFEGLLARWVHGAGDADRIDETRGALVVFIDDLDRCLPAKMVQVLEAIKLFMDKEGCVFVLGADASVIRDAVASHYTDIGVTGESAGDYLEKIIQLRFQLPPIVTDSMKAYLEAAHSIVDDEVRRSWQTIIVGAEINPRKVKTFVNDLNLQWAMLKNTGQAEGVNRDDFTRWQVLMRAAPANFVKRVSDLDDIDLRRKFIDDALKWAQGEESLTATFQEYAGSLRLRRVLRAIRQFSPQFSADTLDAFVYLIAPPAPPAPPPTGEEAPAVEPEAQPIAKGAPPGEGVTRERDRRAAEIRDSVGVVPTRERGEVRRFGGIEFVRVPAGKFVMGSKDDNRLAFDAEKPQYTVEIPYDYWIARYPVTNAQFAAFVEATQYVTTAEKEGGWSGKDFEKGYDWKHPLGPQSDWQDKSDHPVVQISWYDAAEYCKWLNERLQKETGTPLGVSELEIRLPTEAEWEKAARGEYGNEWPWGNEFDAARCNSVEGGKRETTPVGLYSPQGDSPYGAADMAGNVWEWCHSLFKPYPYAADDGREDESASGPRVLRGGAWISSGGLARCASRLDFHPDYRFVNFGFRVVVSPRLS
ncbi:MAG TPA: SUMF1/EgtB/PvdO family nonheme iron enzyme [Anaerolineae bacterium]|nr:SUMF1/EgtB/PvdO family nonheme iron enzyme [Anaerolineae bacterium]